MSFDEAPLLSLLSLKLEWNDVITWLKRFLDDGLFHFTIVVNVAFFSVDSTYQVLTISSHKQRAFLYSLNPSKPSQLCQCRY